MPEKVPLWVVENTFKPYGNRTAPRLETLPHDLKVCHTCKKELYKVADWHYCNEHYYCTEHVEAARRAQSLVWEQERLERAKEWEKNGNRSRGNVHFTPTERAVPRTEAEVPAGNMEEFMYQYWVGSLEPYQSLRSMCRACGAIVFGAMGRAIHKQESQHFYTDGRSCMKALADAIRGMVGLHNCMVCHGYTSKKHYGVPICSPNCHKVWRFAEKQEYPELDLAIAPFWATTNTETGGSSISGSSSSQTPTASPLEEE